MPRSYVSLMPPPRLRGAERNARAAPDRRGRAARRSRGARHSGRTTSAAPGIDSARNAPSSGGVATSSSPAITSVGARIASTARARVPARRSPRSRPRSPRAGIASSISRKRATVARALVAEPLREPALEHGLGDRRRPSARTRRARSCHPSGGPRYAAVQQRTSRSMRSGRLRARAPSRPRRRARARRTRRARARARSRSSRTPRARASTVTSASGIGDRPWPGWS